jgi:hypothetical protein
VIHYLSDHPLVLSLSDWGALLEISLVRTDYVVMRFHFRKRDVIWLPNYWTMLLLGFHVERCERIGLTQYLHLSRHAGHSQSMATLRAAGLSCLFSRHGPSVFLSLLLIYAMLLV